MADFKKNSNTFWYALDNAAKIFPAITNSEVTSVFRLSATLTRPVNIRALFKAVRSIENRFPYYKVSMKKGFFWYYFESTDFSLPVVVDNGKPCRRVPNRGPLLRVLASGKKVSVEFSHLLSDGGGAFEFFKTLLAFYCNILGCEIPISFKIFRPDEKPHEEEFEDAYNRYFKNNVPASVKRPKAFHLPFVLKPKPRFSVLNAIIPVDDIKKEADKHMVNITIYLTSVYLYVLQEILEEMMLSGKKHLRKKLCVEVPVNLRNLYSSATMRNFSLFVMPEINRSLGHYSFEEIIKTVYHQMQLETDVKLVNKILARNVGSERKLLIRSIPLFLKSLFLKMNYYSLGSSQYSGVITNLGYAKFPETMQSQIEYLSIVPPPPNNLIKVSCGVIGYNDNLILSFGNISDSTELEKRFFRFIVKQGMHVKMINQ
jgi:hypothetical protein